MSKEKIDLADELMRSGGTHPYLGAKKRDLIVAALRASAVAEPVAWSSEAGPVPIGNRSALRAWLCWALLMIQEEVPHEEDRAVIGYAAHEIASLPAPEAAPTPDLADPNVVHINMLRGTIAKPTWEQIKHLYPEQAAAPTREEYAAVLAQELWCGATFADAAPSEREAFLRAVDALLALKAAPAK